MMRAVINPRSVVVLALAGVLAACGGSSPTAPGVESPSIQIATGASVLRIFLQAPACPAFLDARTLPLVYTRVTVARVGAEWIAGASSPAAGDVELRFRESGPALGGFVPLAGTIKGSANHLADLLTAMPAWATRVDFGSDTAITAVAFAASATTPIAALSGMGSGTVTMSASTGQSCSGTFFAWGLEPGR